MWKRMLEEGYALKDSLDSRDATDADQITLGGGERDVANGHLASCQGEGGKGIACWREEVV